MLHICHSGAKLPSPLIARPAYPPATLVGKHVQHQQHGQPLQHGQPGQGRRRQKEEEEELGELRPPTSQKTSPKKKKQRGERSLPPLGV